MVDQVDKHVVEFVPVRTPSEPSPFPINSADDRLLPLLFANVLKVGKEQFDVGDDHVHLGVLDNGLDQFDQMGYLDVLHPEQSLSAVVVDSVLVSLDIVILLVLADPVGDGLRKDSDDRLLVCPNDLQERAFLELPY